MPEADDARGIWRRTASRSRASLRRRLKRASRLGERLWRRLHHAWLVTRKQLRERLWGRKFLLGQRVRRGIGRTMKALKPLRRSARKRAKSTMRALKWVVRLRVWRTRTLKQAERAGAVPLEWKNYELSKVGNRLWIKTVQRTVSGIASSDRPILVGPWLSEIGFELMYWIPFLHWTQAYGGIDPSRIWVISRGGTGDWYRHLTPNYLELFSRFSPEEFRRKNDQREARQGGRKHKDLSEFDHEIVEWARGQIGASAVEVLHPSLMYNLYQAYFMKHASIRLVEAFSYYRSYPEAPDIELPPLPDSYVAVKFYSNDSFPATESNRRFVARLLRTLTATTHVVSLETGLRFDDHAEFDDIDRDRLHIPSGLGEATTNLKLQTAIISGAQMFYGTYGGFSYLAPLFGVRTAAFYSHGKAFRTEHLDLAQRVFIKLGCPSFLPLDVADAGALQVA